MTFLHGVLTWRFACLHGVCTWRFYMAFFHGVCTLGLREADEEAGLVTPGPLACGAFLNVLGSTWGLLGSFFGVLGQSSGPLGNIFGRLGAFLGALGTSWDALGGVLGDLGALVERLVNQVDVGSIL